MCSTARTGPPALVASAHLTRTSRILPAQDVVKLRGSVKQVHAADEMSTKMYDTLQLCKASGGHSRTFGESASSPAPHRPRVSRIAVSPVGYTPIPS